jgi:hypothetical protein
MTQIPLTTVRILQKLFPALLKLKYNVFRATHIPKNKMVSLKKPIQLFQNIYYEIVFLKFSRGSFNTAIKNKTIIQIHGVTNIEKQRVPKFCMIYNA